MAFVEKKYFAYEVIALLNRSGQLLEEYTSEKLLSETYSTLSLKEKAEVIDRLQRSGIINNDNSGSFFCLTKKLSETNLYELFSALAGKALQLEEYLINIIKDISLENALQTYMETDLEMRELFDKMIDGTQVPEKEPETIIPLYI